MQIPLANIHWLFLLVRDDWGFQVNPLCRHDITSPFPPSGNEGYVRNRDVTYVTETLCYVMLWSETLKLGFIMSWKLVFRIRISNHKFNFDLQVFCEFVIFRSYFQSCNLKSNTENVSLIENITNAL